MKQKKISLNMQDNKKKGLQVDKKNKSKSKYDTPLQTNAFELSDDQKIERIKKNVEEIMHTLGLDLSDDSLKDTPLRVAKMYVKEIFSGLHPEKKPKATLFENKYEYNGIVIEKNITLYSTCEHHLIPIVGVVHVGYISSGNVIGLSKINRIVQYYAKRPQVQERLTIQIAEELKQILKTQDVAVYIDAKHFCVLARGVEDKNTTTITASYSGKFNTVEIKNEFLTSIVTKN